MMLRRMWTRRAFSGLVAVGVATGAQAAHAQQVADSRRSEAQALRRFAETTHPEGLRAIADPAWRASWDRLEAQADGLDLTAYLIALRRQLVWFHDGHTNVLPFEYLHDTPAAFSATPFTLKLPLKVRAFHDGLHVIEAKDEALPLVGARIMRVGSLSDVELMRRHAEVWPANNPGWAHNWAGVLFGSAGMLHGLGAVAGAADAPISIEATGPDGPVTVTLRPRKSGGDGRRLLARTPAAYEDWAKAQGGGNYVQPLLDRKALYLSVDAMEDTDARSLADLAREALATFDRPEIERLVVDLRRNGGGDNFNGEGLRKGIERSRFNRPGGVYVLTSPRTFSAAQNLATRLERETYALFVGEPTAGAPNHCGDASMFTGAVTGLVAIVSSRRWSDSYPSDERIWTLPDLPVPTLFADWRAGRDPALEIALTHTASGAGDDLSNDRVFFFKRASQNGDWRPFWRQA